MRQSKSILSLRVSLETRRKLDFLRVQHGTLTEAVAVAVDRLYQIERSRTMKSFMYSSETEKRARRRVLDTPELAAHESVIMADWTEGDEHWQWIATATIDEIVSWAEHVEAH